MADEPDNILLIYMRRLDAKMDRVIEELADVHRVDRLEARVERIERRLDLVDMPH